MDTPYGWFRRRWRRADRAFQFDRH